MVIILCECNWGIPGVEALPAHQHRCLSRVRSPYTNELITVNAHDADLNPGWAELDRWEQIDISVDWKKVAMAGAGYGQSRGDAE